MWKFLFQIHEVKSSTENLLCIYDSFCCLMMRIKQHEIKKWKWFLHRFQLNSGNCSEWWQPPVQSGHLKIFPSRTGFPTTSVWGPGRLTSALWPVCHPSHFINRNHCVLGLFSCFGERSAVFRNGLLKGERWGKFSARDTHSSRDARRPKSLNR